VEIVRKQLSTTEIQPAGTRVNVSTDTVQTTPDNGTTWNNAPQLDPRISTIYQLPPRGGSDPQCDAAENMLLKLQNMVLIFENEIAAFQAATAVLAIILVFLPGAGIVIDALLAICDLLITIGASAIAAAFTSDQWDLIRCILYCNIESDGTVTEADYNGILADIYTQCSTVVYDVMFTLLPGIGWVGLTNAGATGEAVGDCSACSCMWTYTWDFKANGASDWFADPSGTGGYGSGSLISPGNGWGTDPYTPHPANSYGAIYAIAINFGTFTIPSDCEITSFLTTVSHISNSDGCHAEEWIGATRPTTVPAFVFYDNTYPAQWGNVAISYGAASGQYLATNCWWIGTGYYLEKVIVRGTGTPPAFTGGALS